MNDWSNLFYSFIIGSALLLSVMGLWFTAIMPGIDQWSKRFFRAFFSVLMLDSLLASVEMLFYLFHIPGTMVYWLMILESAFLALPLPMQTVNLLHCSEEGMRGNRLFRAVMGLWIAFLILLACALFTSRFATVSPDGDFLRGPWYPLLLLPMPLILLINLTGTIRRRKRLSPKTYLSFLVAILPMLLMLVLQLFVEAFALVDISIVLSGLAMYSLILSDQIERDRRRQQEIVRQQQEIAHQNASIMVLQMRPHFIYNTMTSIYCLCNQDPQLARRLVLDFTTYLRKNFTAIASAAPIPFTSELEHTRAYLAVEQAQYEDSLFVEYDTPHTMFRVPPLTLQPIVENAVKHGRNPYAGPLHISIRTRKTDSGSEITVSDDGQGFAPADDGEPHVALRNIRQRLEIMCGGHLAIAPNPGGGTVVTVTIPDAVEKEI